MTYRDKTAAIRTELRALHKLNPETARGFGALSLGAMVDGALSKKEREYLALAIAIAQRCEPCIALHVEALVKLGATRDEVAAVLAVSVQMGGGPALMYAAHALGAWDEMAVPEVVAVPA